MTVAVTWLCVASTVLAGNVEIPSIRDTTLIENAEGARSNGSGPHLFAGRNSQSSNSVRRVLLEFDVASHVPPSSVITDVLVTLHMCQTNAGPETLSLHRVSAGWGEGASSTSGGIGAPSQPGDATWIHTYYDGGFWAHPGGDFIASSTSTVVDGPGFYTWGPTPDMIADVQGWLDDPTSNHGWLLRGNEAASSTVKRFDSREHEDLVLRPWLRVEFLRIEEDEEGDDEDDED